MADNPLTPFLRDDGALILDGGLATELEARGCDLSDDLWSARLLADDPDLIGDVHRAYLDAGADCIITASYQATVTGFMRHGLSEAEAEALLRRSVTLAVDARDAFWAERAAQASRPRPLVAASVGPYAAYKADGSEYTGDYDLNSAELVAFHQRRFGLLADSAADLLACETIPAFDEAVALAELLTAHPGRFAWFSFTCPDAHHISDGTPLAECAAYLAQFEQVAAIGVNCSAPRLMPALIGVLREASDKPVVVYPNSGETYDVAQKRWLGESVPAEFGTFSREWRKLGAAVIGGCCRTSPAHIRQIRDRFR